MAGSNDKSGIQTEIGQDVIDAAMRSVERRGNAEGEVTGAEAGAEAPPSPEEAPPAAAESAPDDVAALRQQVETLQAQLELSQAKGREMMERLREAHERAKEAQERTLRHAADLENYRKRAQKEKEEVQRFGVEKLLKDLLPVVDNLDRALEAATKSPDLDSFEKGVAMTRKSFEDALGRHGVKGFSARGQPFDPRVHEAIQQVETAEVPAGHVVQEVVRGFFLNDRLVRPAMVVVARAPTAPAVTSEPGAAAESATTDTGAPAAPEQTENSSGGSQ